MAAQTGTGARRTGAWHRPRPHSRRDRRRRQIGPIVEALEGRIVLAGATPAIPASVVDTQSGGTPSPSGAAFQQVLSQQATTLQSLGASFRAVQAAGAQFASRTAVAIDQLNVQLRQSNNRHDTAAIAAAIRRDRALLDQGGADVAREEQGLDVARGVADQQAITDEADITNHRFTTLATLVQQGQSTNTAIARSGRRSENTLIRELNKLGDKLTSTIPARTSVSND
jgi:hypothetical protein